MGWSEPRCKHVALQAAPPAVKFAGGFQTTPGPGIPSVFPSSRNRYAPLTLRVSRRNPSRKDFEHGFLGAPDEIDGQLPVRCRSLLHTGYLFGREVILDEIHLRAARSIPGRSRHASPAGPTTQKPLSRLWLIEMETSAGPIVPEGFGSAVLSRADFQRRQRWTRLCQIGTDGLLGRPASQPPVVAPFRETQTGENLALAFAQPVVALRHICRSLSKPIETLLMSIRDSRFEIRDSIKISNLESRIEFYAFRASAIGSSRSA